MGRRTLASLLLSATFALLAAACGRDATPPQGVQAPGADSPTAAVRDLTAHLVASDFAAFARDAVPADLHAQLDTAWREGRTRWPLDELPLASRHPSALAVLAAEDAERDLQSRFNQQFANAASDIRQAAEVLALFGTQYVQQQGPFTTSQRQHYPQIIVALGAWAAHAPLSDRKLATQSIALLTAAAREAGITSAEAFAEAGMEDSLRRVLGVVVAGKQALALYGLDLDADLSAMEITLQSQTGDSAKVRMQYSLAGTPIDTVVDVERRAGRWYVSDFVAGGKTAAARQPDAAKQR